MNINPEWLYLKMLDTNEDDFVPFSFEGISITNPFYDETGRFYLDQPIAYYGKENIAVALAQRE